MGIFNSIDKTKTSKKFYEFNLQEIYRKGRFATPSDIDYSFFENIYVKKLLEKTAVADSICNAIALAALITGLKKTFKRMFNPWFFNTFAIAPNKFHPEKLNTSLKME